MLSVLEGCFQDLVNGGINVLLGWIEINAAPKRLDLDWRWWPLAKEKGVKCVINPDAHRTERLQELWFGVGVARKGWLTKADVMNCLPLGKIERELRRKRDQ